MSFRISVGKKTDVLDPDHFTGDRPAAMHERLNNIAQFDPVA
jgi:hypothetical protein